MAPPKKSICNKCGGGKPLGKRYPSCWKKYRVKYVARLNVRKKLAEYQKKYRKQNATKISNQRKSFYSKNKLKIKQENQQRYQAKKQGILEQKKSYYSLHRESILERSSHYYKKNKNKINDRSKHYRRSHPDKIRLHNKLRYQREITGESFTRQEWDDLLKACNYQCLCCKRNNIKITVDHVIPLIKGGSNLISNIQPLCGQCNSRKKTKTIDYRTEKIKNELFTYRQSLSS